MKKIILSCLVASFLLSCKKEDNKDVSPSKNENTVVYYVDGNETSKSKIDFDKEDLVIVVDPSNTQEVEVFTNISALNKNMRASSSEIQTVVNSYQKAEVIRASAETKKAMKQYEQTGELPASYQTYLNELQPSTKNARTETLFGFLYDESTTTGPSIPSTNYPVMPYKWSNRISSVSLYTLVGVWFYDKTFFRGTKVYVKPGISTASGISLSLFNFSDKTSSVLHIL